MTLKISIDNALFPLSYFFGFCLCLCSCFCSLSYSVEITTTADRNNAVVQPLDRRLPRPRRTRSSARVHGVYPSAPSSFLMVSVPSFPALRRIRRSNKSTIKNLSLRLQEARSVPRDRQVSPRLRNLTRTVHDSASRLHLRFFCWRHIARETLFESDEPGIMVLLKPGPPFCVHSSLFFFPIYPGGLCFEALLLPPGWKCAIVSPIPAIPFGSRRRFEISLFLNQYCDLSIFFLVYQNPWRSEQRSLVFPNIGSIQSSIGIGWLPRTQCNELYFRNGTCAHLGSPRPWEEQRTRRPPVPPAGMVAVRR